MKTRFGISMKQEDLTNLKLHCVKRQLFLHEAVKEAVDEWLLRQDKVKKHDEREKH